MGDLIRNLERSIFFNNLNKRLKRECLELSVTYDILSAEEDYMIDDIDFIDNVDKRKHIILSVRKKAVKNIPPIHFIITDYYPFKPPKIFIGSEKYTNFFNLKTTRFNSMLKLLTGTDCLCCKSYTCNYNWSPGYRITHLLEEIEKNKKIKKNIINKLLLDQIKNKYLNSDIELESWLF